MTRREEDVAETMFTCSTHDYICLLYTSMGFDDIEVIYLCKPQETDDEKEQSEEKNHLLSLIHI